jgi:hypothetical protein
MMTDKKSLEVTVAFVRDVMRASTLEGSRSRGEMFADRLAKAVSEPTLAKAMEELVTAMQCSMDKIFAPGAASMMQVAAGPHAARVMRWLREQTKLCAMLAMVNDPALVAETIAEIELPEDGLTGSAAVRQPFAIGIKATCEAPLGHGGDGKCGNATLFRRIDVMATNGAHLVLPYYAGNAVRGQMRDLLADHFVRALGMKADRAKPQVALWFFYALYSGGCLEEKSDATKAVKKLLGDNGAIRADGIRGFRDKLPALSLLGCALGNRVLPGRVQFADLRPQCAEWGTGAQPVANLMTWEFLTRREDHEDHQEHHGMIANTEVLRAGTVLEGGVDMDSCMPEIERSALGLGLTLLQKRGMLGSDNRRGFGKVAVELEGVPDPALYETFLADNRGAILAYLAEIGALPEPSK